MKIQRGEFDYGSADSLALIKRVWVGLERECLVSQSNLFMKQESALLLITNHFL